MKKIIAILAVLMLIPFSAFGLESLSDDVLDDVTAQAGISIAADITMDVHFDTMAWGDGDGLGGTTTAGWIGMTDFNLNNLHIKLRSDYAATPQDIQLFTIDVATDANGTYVHMLLGTQQITFDSMGADVALGAGVASLNEKLGSFYIDTFAMYMNKDSFVDIRSNASGTGVTFDFAINIDSITMDAMSWGDDDGIAGSVVAGLTTDLDGDVDDFTNAGYIGLANVVIDDLAITGQMIIDVATIDTATIGATGWDPTAGSDPDAYLLGVYNNMLLANPAYAGGLGGQTGLLLQFNNLHITMASFAADVVLASDNALTAGKTLGSFYADGMDVTMNGWVGIFAHDN